jgi:spore coat protein H
MMLQLCAAVLAWASVSATPRSADALFAPDRVWSIHLTLTADEWKALEPTRRPGVNFGAPPPAPTEKPKDSDRPVSVSPFGFEYPYVHADVEIDGEKVENVGLRFKGNSSFLAARQLKRPFKIDFNRWVEDQDFLGLAMLNFSNNTMDPTQMRERISYSVFRTAGVPAPRTTYAKLFLTVPGVHDRVLLGLYTVIEPVDKVFLADRFGRANGMLLKPERAQGFPYLGDDWSAYPDRYHPKDEPKPKETRRLIEFTKLIHKADDAEFQRRVAEFMDVEAFLKLTAANAALTNLDSFFGVGHNYYLYLNPATDQFVWIPYDLDHSLGGFGMVGSPEQMMNWSIKKPYLGDNKLVQRLLAIPENEQTYRAHLKTLIEGPYRAGKMLAMIDATQAAIQPTLDEEAKANAGGMFGFGFGRFMPKPPDVKTFIATRIDSLSDQLAGKSQGHELRSFGGQGARRAAPGVAQAVLRAADSDNDGSLTREEADAIVRSWRKKLSDARDEKAIADAIKSALPNIPFAGPTPSKELAASLAKRAASDQDELSQKLFKEWDRNSDGQLSREELTRGIAGLLPAR